MRLRMSEEDDAGVGRGLCGWSEDDGRLEGKCSL